MRLRSSLLLACLAALLAALTVPATAAAAGTHYAAPTNQGFGDCTSPQNACTLPVALTGSPTEVVLATGTYGSSGSPVLNDKLLPIGTDMHGPATGELPHLFVSGSLGITAGVNRSSAGCTSPGPAAAPSTCPAASSIRSSPTAS